MRENKVYEGVNHLTYLTFEEMNSKLLRIVFQDDPRFSKNFTQKNIVSWFQKNLPEKDIYSMYQGYLIENTILDWSLYGNLSKGEWEFRKKVANSEFLCTITTGEDTDESVFFHELTHAIYSINSDYEKEINEVLNNLDNNFKIALETELKNFGYIQDEYLDEMHAYLIAMPSFFKKGDNSLRIKKLNKKLRGIFEKYYFE